MKVNLLSIPSEMELLYTDEFRKEQYIVIVYKLIYILDEFLL